MRRGTVSGLDIYDHWDWSVQHPVVRLSFSGYYGEAGRLESNILTQLELIEKAFGVETVSGRSGVGGSDCLLHLLRNLHEKTSKRVAVLVDEYDKPILDVIKNTEMAELNRDYLGGFYSVIQRQCGACAVCVCDWHYHVLEGEFVFGAE